MRARLSNHRTLALVASVLSLAIASSAGAAVLSVATLGDSTTDEFMATVGPPFIDTLPVMNWMEQLAEDRAAYFDFGSLESDPSVRGEPRNDGYSQNWARGGASAVTPGWGIEPFDSQVAGAAAQITSGDVDFAYILIGSNDFAIRAESAGLTFDPADPSYQAFAQSIFDAIFAAVDTLQAAGAAPIAVGWFGVASTRQDVKDAAEALSFDIWTEAIARGVTYINLYLFHWPGSLALDPTRQNLMFAGELIPLASVADAADLAPPGTPGVGPCSRIGCATETYAFNYLTHDANHPGTIVHGFMANEFIKAVNDHFGSSIPLLTEQEILANAIGEPLGPMQAEVKLKIQLKFNKPSKDKMQVKVKDWQLPAGVAPTEVTVNVGGVQCTGTLDAKGKYKSPDGRDSITMKQSKKTQLWSITVKRKTSDFAADLWDEGCTNADNPKPGLPVTVPLTIEVGGVAYGRDVDLLYKSKLGKKGTAK